MIFPLRTLLPKVSFIILMLKKLVASGLFLIIIESIIKLATNKRNRTIKGMTN